jgi:hypothetical protein
MDIRELIQRLETLADKFTNFDEHIPIDSNMTMLEIAFVILYNQAKSQTL